MSKLSQSNFDRAEEIAQALNTQEALDIALFGILDASLPRSATQVVYGLLHAQAMCRSIAMAETTAIARSGREAKSNK